MNSRLYMIEGLPGSGKTTTAELLKCLLKEKQVDARLHIEGDVYHPADYESVAYLTNDEWTIFQEKFALLDARLFAESYEDHTLMFYRKWQSEKEVPKSAIEFLQARDIYELPFELHQALILKKWETFVNQALEADTTYIFEYCFLQNPLTVGLIKYDLSEATLQAYITHLAAIISPLRPVLIYVNQSDIERSFRKALQERSRE